MEKILTVNDVAEILQVKAITVREMFREKRLRGFKVGKAWRTTERMLREDIDALARGESPESLPSPAGDVAGGVAVAADPEPKPADQGQAFIAVDVDAMMAPQVFADRMKKAVSEIRNVPKAAGHDRVYLPGEMEWERRDDAVANGLLLPDYVLMNLFAIADKNGLSDRLVELFG